MTRNYTAFGLYCLAVLAVCSMAAPTASAITVHHHVSAEEPAELEAEALGTNVFRAETENSENYTECENVEVHGSVWETQQEVTVLPTYSGCKLHHGEQLVLFDITGSCKFRFLSETTEGNPTGGEHASVAIEGCGSETGMIITVTAFHLKCMDIPEQLIEDAVRYEEDGEGSIIVVGTAHSIESRTTEGLAGCGEAIHENGTYVGSFKISAHNGAEETVGLQLTEFGT